MWRFNGRALLILWVKETPGSKLNFLPFFPWFFHSFNPTIFWATAIWLTQQNWNPGVFAFKPRPGGENCTSYCRGFHLITKQWFRTETKFSQAEMKSFLLRKKGKRRGKLKLWLLLHRWRPLNLPSAFSLAQAGVGSSVLEVLEETLWSVLCRWQVEIIVMVIFGLESLRKNEVECSKSSLLPLCRIESLDLLRNVWSKRNFLL